MIREELLASLRELASGAPVEGTPPWARSPAKPRPGGLDRIALAIVVAPLVLGGGVALAAAIALAAIVAG